MPKAAMYMIDSAGRRNAWSIGQLVLLQSQLLAIPMGSVGLSKGLRRPSLLLAGGSLNAFLR
jgi:hypothetical protein